MEELDNCLANIVDVDNDCEELREMAILSTKMIFSLIEAIEQECSEEQAHKIFNVYFSLAGKH